MGNLLWLSLTQPLIGIGKPPVYKTYLSFCKLTACVPVFQNRTGDHRTLVYWSAAPCGDEYISLAVAPGSFRTSGRCFLHFRLQVGLRPVCKGEVHARCPWNHPAGSGYWFRVLRGFYRAVVIVNRHREYPFRPVRGVRLSYRRPRILRFFVNNKGVSHFEANYIIRVTPTDIAFILPTPCRYS